MSSTTTAYREELVYVPRAGTLYDVLELILDRGMVIDAFVRVSLVGIEILKIDARIVVASVDTYLRFAETCGRLDLEHDSRSMTVPDLLGGAGRAVTKQAGKRAVRSTGQKLKKAVSGAFSEEDEGDEESEQRRRPASRSRSAHRDSEEEH